MSDKSCNSFELLNKINVNDHIEKKGGFNYLSWPYAVAELRKNFPDARWETKRFDGLPYLKTPLGYFVEVECTVNGLTLSQIHPVLDNRNQPIKEPNPMQINTSIQRATVKAMALHGLGLYIYAGEDLPMDEEVHETNAKPVQSVPAAKPYQKSNYVANAVQKVMEAEKQPHNLSVDNPQNTYVGMATDEEIREIFGDIEIVDATPIDEAQVKRIKAKCKDTGATTVENYGELYKMIRDQLNIGIKRSADFEGVAVSDFERLCKFLDSKKGMFKVA